jgi:NAD(P)-dependent dehydrogenase (short-subunit alcohol dehydrogenase family)
VEKTSTDFLSRRTFIAGSAAAAAAATAQTTWSKEERRMTVCVLGASGMVGNAVLKELLKAGHRVIAVSRSTEKLADIRSRYGPKSVETLVGDVASDDTAARLREALVGQFGKPDGIVAALSSPSVDHPTKVLGSPTDLLRQTFDSNFYPHVVAAKALIPQLGQGGVYVGINGGLPDFVLPGMANVTMTQSALRSLYLALAQEAADLKCQVRMLGIFGLVATQEHPAKVTERSIPDSDVGHRVLEILRNPTQFPGPLLAIKARAYSS